MKSRNIIYTVFFLLFFTSSLMLITIQSNEYELPTNILWDEQFDDITSWQIYPGSESYHALDSFIIGDDTYLYVYENYGYASTSGFAYNTIDLSSWTKTSDLEIQLKFQALSDNDELGDPITNFRIGIKNYNLETLWSHSEDFPYESDSGWLERTEIVIPKEEFDSEDCSQLILYVGYYDLWPTNWNQRVYVDYISLLGIENEEFRSNTIELLAFEGFTYDEEVFESYWFLPDEVQEHYSLVLDEDYATVSEEDGERLTDAFAYGLLDLNSWTGLTDMTIEYKIKAESTYGGPVTRYSIGIRTMNGEIKWSQEETFSATNSGWKDRSFTLSEDDFQVSGTYILYWGYRDLWDYDWNQKVTLDYFKVFGEKKPEGFLVNNKAGITTKAESHVKNHNPLYDQDELYISYCSQADFTNSLGFGSDTDTFIAGSMEVALDPDATYPYPNTRWWNVIDKVKIQIEIQTVDGAYKLSPNTISYFKTNQEDDKGVSENLEFATGLINIALDSLSFIPGCGQTISFAGKVFAFFLFEAFEVGEDQVIYTQERGKSSAEYDFYAPFAYGSTDFKMEFAINSPVFENEITRITITYSTEILTYEEWYNDLTLLDTVEYSFTQVFDYMGFSSDYQYRKMIVAMEDNTLEDFDTIFDFTTGDDSNSYVDIDCFESKNGEGWYLLTGIRDSSWIDITVAESWNDDGYMWYLLDMRLSYWTLHEVQLMPVMIAESSLRLKFDPGDDNRGPRLFYKIYAKYIWL